MSNPERSDPSRSTLRLGFLLAALAWAIAAASHAFGAEPQWTLAVGTATAAPQTAVEVPVVLTTHGASVSAVAFSIEFDAAKLVLDANPNLGSKVEIPAPTMFTSSSWVGTEEGAIGVVVYDKTRPIGVLSDGPVASIRFRVLPGASGFAAVRVSTTRPYSASGPRGETLEGEIAPGGGITIAAPAGSFLPPIPAERPPEERSRTARPSPEDLLVAIPLVAPASGSVAPWHASLLLHNGGSEPSTARLTLMRARGLASVGPLDVIIPAGTTRRWDDAAGELFGLPGASGALAIERASDELIATSSMGDSRQPMQPASETDARLIAVPDSPERRSSITIANLGAETARFLVEIRDAGGALLGSREVSVEMKSVVGNIHVSPSGFDAATELTILIRPLAATAKYLAWSTTPDRDRPPIVQTAR